MTAHLASLPQKLDTDEERAQMKRQQEADARAKTARAAKDGK